MTEAYTRPALLKVAVELLPAGDAAAGEWLADAQAMDAAGAAALLLPAGADGRDVLLGALAAVTTRAALDGRGAPAAVSWLARGRLVESLEGWRRLEPPRDREHWAAQHAEALEAGAEGVVVRHFPGLLDLLRNPDAVADRSDLNLAQG